MTQWGLPWWSSGGQSAFRCRGHRFNPWRGRSRRLRGNYAHYRNSWTCTGEPVSHDYWSPCTLSPCSATREATAMGSLSTATKSSPDSPQLEKACVQQRGKTAQPKIKVNSSLKKKKWWSSDTCCNTDEPQIMLWKKPDTKGYISFNPMNRKLLEQIKLETEYRLLGPGKGWRRWWGETA